MKIEFVYDAYSQSWPAHGPFNESDLENAPHGLSGTEIPMFGMAAELAKMGHEVSVFSRFKDPWKYPPFSGSVAYRDLDEPTTNRMCDVAVAFHDARRLETWPAKLKVAHHQSFLVSNKQQDATFTGADFADIYITATDHVARHLERAYGWPKVHVVPNAWDFGTYHPWQPVPGRLIYTTSLERGFHRLLEAFPLIREQCPEAHIVAFERGGPMVEKLKANSVDGVTLVKASSLNAVLRELSFAACFAYPCQPPSPTEVFPVSLLQACAAGVPVVLAPADGIEKLFADAVTLTPPVGEPLWKELFVGSVVEILKSRAAADYCGARGKRWSAPLTHAASARKLAEVLGLT